jgi:oxygen-independent coproporphyrinogen-3 oxidase
MMTDLADFLTQNNRFQSYLYSYPHKTAYRFFEHPVDLRKLWANENKNALFLYTHIPFCRLKCAFCNLFTLSKPQDSLVEHYLAQLRLEAEVMRELLGEAQFAGYAFGGGTPSHLSLKQLQQLFDIHSSTLKLDLSQTSGSFEVSPDTLTDDKLRFLHQQQIQRLSIGIQSFIEPEARAMGRNQPTKQTELLLDNIVHYDFPVFNIDLIYGIAGQTPASWLRSLETALRFQPDELFLYPLYVRPLTGLFQKNTKSELAITDWRIELYNLGRDFLTAQGYVQDSMRLFRRPQANLSASSEYSCQEDGMIGLGVNARSYTRDLHYSTEYAVAKPRVSQIIEQYLAKQRADFYYAEHGIQLTLDDRKRRYLIKSLLKADGLNCAHYREYFATEALADFPELQQLVAMELACHNSGYLRLTQQGMAYSDLIGHWFISANVRQKMQEYQCQ